ncbi:RHS repeat-associated core domain-containing protein [Salibacter halophilus]|uniref:RHS repeat-associated core domain-containing protein n=1 Tax=Salibacter halophilus TaxID=1803916 RepID=A0A6N6M9K3_9FLAO|nr:hypothetical protein [Salibacter halophilus]KAB1064902.1 hypothetical protein F3059_05990 [Salibacter halophilus]
MASSYTLCIKYVGNTSIPNSFSQTSVLTETKLYNLQGWLKSMNSNTGNTTRDPGKDGETGTGYLANQPDVHARFAQDVFGFSLGYYENDYAAIDPSKDNFIADQSPLNSNINHLFNGNISTSVTALLDHDQNRLEIQLKNYKYDQINRLKSQTVYTADDNIQETNAWSSGVSSNGTYDTWYSYDLNGNIDSLSRNGNQTGNLGMDHLKYHYNSGTNQLDQVTDDVASSTYSNDFNGSEPGNFQYDDIGRLISDDSAQIAEIEWTINNKVKSITRTSGSTLDDLEFRYDPNGNRIVKIVKPRDNNGDPEPATEWRYTHYRRDASGQVMATYETTVDGDQLAHVAKEHYLYCDQRLGMEKQTDSVNIATVYNYNGLDDYQLNHLTRYAKGSEFMISLSGSSLSSTPGIKFHYTDIDSVEHITQACTTTGNLANVTSALRSIISAEPDLDVIWVSNTSFKVTANRANATLPIAAKVSYNKFEDLTITITALEETEQISQHFHHYGNSQYELTNHLGNVQSVVSNRYLFANETIHEEDFSTDFWGGMTIWGSSGLSVNTNNGDLTASGSNGYVTLSLNTTPSVGHELRFDLADASSSITVRIRNTTTNNIISSEIFTNGTDHKYQFTPNGDIQIEWYTSPNQTFSIDNVEVIERGDEILADVRTYQDYYPFGMLSRKYNSPDYSRGFNGQIKTDEIAGEGNHNTARYWEYDTRLGRRWNRDPIFKEWESEYVTFNNNPILKIDHNGDNAGEYEKVVNEDGTVKTTKVSDLGDDKGVDFTHITGGEHDGQTYIESQETGVGVYMSSSKNIKDFIHRPEGIDWENIYEEFKKGTGPENSLITTPAMLQEIMESPQFADAFKHYLDKGAPKKLAYESSFGIPGALKSGKNMTAQMIGKANYSFYNTGDKLVITIMDSKSVSSYYWIAKLVPSEWVNKNRSNDSNENIPESTTRQTYIMIFDIKQDE